MAELIAKSPLSGQVPLTIGALTLSETAFEQITSVAPFKGRQKPLAAALKSFGLGFPAPNRFSRNGAVRLVWTGRDQAFLIGAPAQGLGPHAALTDQSDGWACLALQGPQAADALMRLVPINLHRLTNGDAARAPLGHMQTVLICNGPDDFDILIFRSMARTAWHEIETAMHSLAARAALSH